MKKYLVMLLLAGALGLTACGGSQSAAPAPEKTEAAAPEHKEEAAPEEAEAPAEEAAPEAGEEGDATSAPTKKKGEGKDGEHGKGDATSAPTKKKGEGGANADAVTGPTKNGGELKPGHLDLINALYARTENFANGIATADIIPVNEVEELYTFYDTIEEMGLHEAPIMLREYAATEDVYLDYANDISIKWNKKSGDIILEPTDVKEREDFKQKAHK